MIKSHVILQKDSITLLSYSARQMKPSKYTSNAILIWKQNEDSQKMLNSISPPLF